MSQKSSLLQSAKSVSWVLTSDTLVIENILAGRRLTRPDYALPAEQCLVIVLGLWVASAMSRLTPSLAAGLGNLLLVTITAAWIAFRYWDLLFDPERW